MIETVKIRFRRSHRGYKAGQVVPFAKGPARSLEMFGLAEILREPQLELAVAPEPAGIEHAVAPVAKVKRTRKRRLP